MRWYLSFIALFFLQTADVYGQLPHLVYLKTFPASVYPLVSFNQSSTTYDIGIYSSDPINASIFPDQNNFNISTELEYGVAHVSYNSNLDVESNFETAGFAGISGLYVPENLLIYSQQANLVNPGNLFESIPPVSNTDPSGIISSTFLLTYDPLTHTLKMPFHCSCLDLQSESAQSHILTTFFTTQAGISDPSIYHYNSAAWMSDNTVIMALNVYDDVTLNWTNNFPIGDNYWGTFWVKINPFNGMHIVTPMVSQNGSAINLNINGTDNADYLYRTGVVRGNGVQMSPDGTTWDSFEGDSLYNAYVIKENSVGEQAWMRLLFSYQTEMSDELSNVHLKFLPSKILEIGTNAYLGSFIRIHLNAPSLGDTIFYNDHMSPVDTLAFTGEFSQQVMVSSRQITRFDENGDIISKLFFPNRHQDASDISNTTWHFQEPELFRVNDKLGWPLTYNATGDTTLYFLKKYADGSLDSAGVDLPAGRGTFILWLDADLSIVDVMNIPFSTGGNAFTQGVSITEVSVYHEDSLMITGTISSGTTTTMDPEGLAESIAYSAKRTFAAFYSLPDYLTDIESVVQNKSNNVQLFPNPAKNQITVQTDYVFPVGYKVVDITGRKIAQGVIPISEKRYSISVGGFEPGIYLLVLEKNRELLATRKFMVY